MGHWQDVQKSQAFRDLIRREDADRKRFDKVREQQDKYYCSEMGCSRAKDAGKDLCAEHARGKK